MDRLHSENYLSFPAEARLSDARMRSTDVLGEILAVRSWNGLAVYCGAPTELVTHEQSELSAGGEAETAAASK